MTPLPPDLELPGDDPDRPVYTIGTIAKAVGVPPATIRTWEERYEGIVPYRDPSGRRLYSRRQLDRLRFVKDQVDRGLQPSEAHRLLEGRPFHTSATGGGLGSADLHLPQLRFLGWIMAQRPGVQGLLSELGAAVGAMTAFVEANLSHPEFGLTATVMVRANAPDRVRPERRSGWVGVAWSEMPEVAQPLSKGETLRILTSELGPAAADVYRGTDIRSELKAPIHHRGEWLGSVAVAEGSERAWTDEDALTVEQARDLLVADFAASEARARFGRLLEPAEEERAEAGNGTTGG